MKLCIVLIFSILTGFALCAADEASILEQSLNADLVSLVLDNQPVVPVLNQSHPHGLNTALCTVGVQIGAALVVLSNTFGRLALSGYLGYKAYHYVLSAMRKEDKRHTYALQAVACAAASAMLLCDGYAWVLNRQNI